MKSCLPAALALVLWLLPAPGMAQAQASADPVTPYLGRWLLDFDASDSIGPMMELMDTPWIARKLAGMMSPTVTITKLGERGLTMVNENPIKTTQQEMFVDGVEREHEDPLGRKVIASQTWNDVGQLVVVERTHVDDDRVFEVISTWIRVEKHIEVMNKMQGEDEPLVIRRIFRPKP
jgi:hypothetical protein